MTKVNRCRLLQEDGYGVCGEEGTPILVTDLLPEEEAELHITQKKQGFYLARVLKRMTTSADRDVPFCPHFYRCGGCKVQHLVYSAQLGWKQGMVRRLFDGAGLQAVELLPIIGMEAPMHYRNKAEMPVVRSKSGTLLAGYYQSYSHEMVDVVSCDIQEPIIMEAFLKIKSILREMEIDVYSEVTKLGWMRHLYFRVGHVSKELLVGLVVTSSINEKKEALIKRIQEEVKEITTLIISINPENTNVILGNETEVCFGKGYIHDTLGSLTFRISLSSFYQVNVHQTEQLYERVIKLASLNQEDVVLDAYSGIGTIGLILSKYVKKVYGVEINEQAIKDATYNAKANQIKNIEFFVSDIKDWMKDHPKLKSQVTTVVMDPPRKGCSGELLNTLLQLKPKKMVYISCNPVTLVRDLNILMNDYEIQEVQPFDLFPHTNHVETVVLLTLK